jgi:hypothetical protein
LCPICLKVGIFWKKFLSENNNGFFYILIYNIDNFSIMLYIFNLIFNVAVVVLNYFSLFLFSKK